MMVFMSKKMAIEAAKQQEKRDKEMKTVRNLSIAAVALGGANLVRGVVATIKTINNQNAIYARVDTGFKSFSLPNTDDDDDDEEPAKVNKSKKAPAPVPPAPPVIIDGDDEADDAT